jgi:hypothetical protein
LLFLYHLCAVAVICPDRMLRATIKGYFCFWFACGFCTVQFRLCSLYLPSSSEMADDVTTFPILLGPWIFSRPWLFLCSGRSRSWSVPFLLNFGIPWLFGFYCFFLLSTPRNLPPAWFFLSLLLTPGPFFYPPLLLSSWRVFFPPQTLGRRRENKCTAVLCGVSEPCNERGSMLCGLVCLRCLVPSPFFTPFNFFYSSWVWI